MSNTKQFSKPKEDRYQKFNKNPLHLKQSSYMTSSIQTTATISPIKKYQQQPKQCRICLSQEDNLGQKQLFSPCKCTGSVKYIHKNCFISWVNKLLQQKTSKQKTKLILQGCQCQICKYKIPIKGGIQQNIASCDQISSRLKRRPILFTVFTLIQSLCIIVLGFVISMMIRLGLGFDQSRIINSVIMICSLAILICLSFGVGYFYVNDYFIVMKLVISDFGDLKNKYNDQLNPEMNDQLHPQISHNRIQQNENNVMQISSSMVNLDD